MDDLGDLAQCLVCDRSRLSFSRRLRGRALAASMLLETTVVAGLLLWPTINTAVLPLERTPAPVPVFHRTPPSDRRPARQAERSAPRQSRILRDRVLYQSPRIPSRVDAEEEPPAPIDLLIPIEPRGPGSQISGDGTQVTNGVRPAGPRSIGPIAVSTGVMAALLIHRVQPVYPLAARITHLTGAVQLRAIIGTDGSIRDLEIISGNPILAAAAVEAVRQWRYQPTLLSGKPVEVETLITVQFEMQ